MKTITRRTFVFRGGQLVAGAALGGWTATSAQRVTGANERINVALIGCGGRGRFVVRGLAEQGANVACLCDLRDDRLDEVAQFIADVQPVASRREKEMMRVFEAKDVDAVIIATPDHWHALAAIRACQAGKDVYVEKPHAYSIWESGQMISAARKYKRIVQVGTQNRSAPYVLQARDYIRTGKLGQVHFIKVHNLKFGQAFHLGNPGTPPPGFNWDAFQGRAPARPFNRQIIAKGWHQFWDYSGGDIVNDGIHQLDIAFMLMGDPGLPTSVRALGGRYAYAGDDSEVPDVLTVNWDFGGRFALSFDMTEYPKYMQKDSPVLRQNQPLPSWSTDATRVEVYGSELLLTLGRHGGGFAMQQVGGRVVEKVLAEHHPDLDHYQNFLECMRSRKTPTAELAVAHASAASAHMGNIAHRLGNLALRHDPATGRFDDEKANAMIKPTFRKGYEVPEVV